MIRIDKGDLHLEGTLPLIMAELSTMIHSMNYAWLIEKKGFLPEKSRDLILKAVQDGLKSDEEIEAQAKRIAKEHLVDVLDHLKDLLTGKDEE